MAEIIYNFHNIAVFKNSYINKEGVSDVFYSLNIQRSYKDKNGQWVKQTISETPEGALLLADLTKLAGLKAIELNANKNGEKTPF